MGCGGTGWGDAVGPGWMHATNGDQKKDQSFFLNKKRSQNPAMLAARFFLYSRWSPIVGHRRQNKAQQLELTKLGSGWGSDQPHSNLWTRATPKLKASGSGYPLPNDRVRVYRSSCPLRRDRGCNNEQLHPQPTLRGVCSANFARNRLVLLQLLLFWLRIAGLGV